jgi:hypothetical protein
VVIQQVRVHVAISKPHLKRPGTSTKEESRAKVSPEAVGLLRRKHAAVVLQRTCFFTYEK